MKRFHVHAHVEDLQASIAFYSKMFGARSSRSHRSLLCRQRAAGKAGFHPREGRGRRASLLRRRHG